MTEVKQSLPEALPQFPTATSISALDAHSGSIWASTSPRAPPHKLTLVSLWESGSVTSEYVPRNPGSVIYSTDGERIHQMFEAKRAHEAGLPPTSDRPPLLIPIGPTAIRTRLHNIRPGAAGNARKFISSTISHLHGTAAHFSERL